MSKQSEHESMESMADGAKEQNGAGELRALAGMAVAAPANAFARFRRRASLVQGTRMLFESQVVGFWVVLDAFLRLFLGGSGQGRAVKGDRA